MQTEKRASRDRLPLKTYTSACLLYTSLAIDVLATSAQGRGNFIFAYHSLMAYAYYQLGDRSMVKYHYDECEKAGARVNNGPMQMIKTQCLEDVYKRQTVSCITV